MIRCPKCNGHRFVIVEKRVGSKLIGNNTECPWCHGTGVTTELEASKAEEEYQAGKLLARRYIAWTEEVERMMGKDDTQRMTCPACGTWLEWKGGPPSADAISSFFKGEPLKVTCPRCKKNWDANVMIGEQPGDYTRILIEAKE